MHKWINAVNKQKFTHPQATRRGSNRRGSGRGRACSLYIRHCSHFNQNKVSKRDVRWPYWYERGGGVNIVLFISGSHLWTCVYIYVTHGSWALQSHDLSGKGIKLWITYILFWPHKGMEGLPGWEMSSMPGQPPRKHEHERRYTPFTHPFILTRRIWNDYDGEMTFGDLYGRGVTSLTSRSAGPGSYPGFGQFPGFIFSKGFFSTICVKK